jgi:hypothetical protein
MWPPFPQDAGKKKKFPFDDFHWIVNIPSPGYKAFLGEWFDLTS